MLFLRPWTGRWAVFWAGKGSSFCRVQLFHQCHFPQCESCFCKKSHSLPHSDPMNSFWCLTPLPTNDGPLILKLTSKCSHNIIEMLSILEGASTPLGGMIISRSCYWWISCVNTVLQCFWGMAILQRRKDQCFPTVVRKEKAICHLFCFCVGLELKRGKQSSFCWSNRTPCKRK